MSDDETRRELARFWRVYKTTKQMLFDRGYEISEEECAESLEAFRARAADRAGILNKTNLAFSAGPSANMIRKFTALPTKANPTPTADIGTIYVSFNDEAAVGIKQLRNFAQLLNDNHFHNGIFVTGASVTSSALKAASNLPISIEVFQEQDLLVNITRHELVPKHILLAPDEKRALLDRYRLKETQLPRIRYEDPVSKYLGLKRGHVVKIIRKSETAGRYASYRWVI